MEWVIGGVVVLVLLAVLGSLVGEVLGLNSRLDVADEEERRQGLLRIDDQRRD